MTTNTNYVFFHHNEKKYLYSRTKNSIFSSSEIAEKYLYKSQDFQDKSEIELFNLEFNNLTQEDLDSNQCNEVEIYMKISKSNVDSTIDSLKNTKYNKDLNYFFIFEFDNISEIEKFFSLYKFFKNQAFKIKFLFKENLNHILDITILKKIREIGIEFLFYADSESLSKFLDDYNINGKTCCAFRD